VLLVVGVDLIEKSDPQPFSESGIELPVDSAVGEKCDAEIALVETDDDQIAQRPHRERSWFFRENPGLAEMAARADPADNPGNTVIAAEDQFGLAHGDDVKHLTGVPFPVDVLPLGNDLHPGNAGKGSYLGGRGILEQDGTLKMFGNVLSFHGPATIGSRFEIIRRVFLISKWRPGSFQICKCCSITSASRGATE